MVVSHLGDGVDGEKASAFGPARNRATRIEDKRIIVGEERVIVCQEGCQR